MIGYSRDSFYRFKELCDAGGEDAPREISPRKPNLRNRIDAELEALIVTIALDQPAWGQHRVANELAKRWSEDNATRRRTGNSSANVPSTAGRRTPSTWAISKASGTCTSRPSSILTRRSDLPSCTRTRPRGALLRGPRCPAPAGVLTDRGTEYCGAPDRHPYELYLAVEDIEHTRTKAKRPQTNGICERFNKTFLDEFYRVTFRKRLYATLDELQTDLDRFIDDYNTSRSHQGRWCYGKTPM